MEIEITNPGATSPVTIDVDSWSLKRYQDTQRASEFKLQCARRVPIQKFAAVTALDGADVRFLGYVRNSQIIWPDKREITCRGREELLMHRYSGRWSYQVLYVRLVHPFQSIAPPQTPDIYSVTGNSGLLFIANSMIPQYSMTAMGSYIYKLPGWGTASRIGTNAIYVAGDLLPRVSTYALMEATDMSCYADASDLYIRNATHPIGLSSLAHVSALNAFDTGIRLGNVDNPEIELQGNLQLNFDRIQDILINLAEFYEQYPVFRYASDKVCYLDILADPTGIEYDLPEEAIHSLKQSNPNDLQTHGLIGTGIGSRDGRHIYGANDPTYKGIWYQDVLDVGDNQGWMDTHGLLKTITDAEYARRLEDDIFEVDPGHWPHRPRPWDTVNLRLEGEPVPPLGVASVRIDNAGKQILELGGRRSEIMDAFNAKRDLSQAYLYEYLIEAASPINSSGSLIIGDVTHGWCTGWTFSVTVPASVYQADGSHRVTLDFTMDADVRQQVAVLYIIVNGMYNALCMSLHYLINDPVNYIDITSLIANHYGYASTIIIYCMLKGDWSGSHSNCSGHPTAAMTSVVRSWKRTPPT